MGIFDKALKLFKFSSTSGFPTSLGASSVFAIGGSGLSPVIAKDLGFSGMGYPATLQDAYSVPAVYRAMALYSVGTASVQITGGDDWLRENVGSITPENRLAQMVQDLILYRETCLMVSREGGKIVAGVVLPRECWGLDFMGNVLLNGEPVEDQTQFIYISSLLPIGLLEAAAATIEHYIDLRNTIRSRSKNPIPLVELHITEEFEGDAAELKKAQDDWTAARQSENGAVAFTPKGIELKIHTTSGDEAMLTGARNSNRLDVANFLNINASLLEGANGTSDTYQNTLQSKDEFLELSLGLWLKPIQARLNAPDVTDNPTVSFDLSELGSGDAKGNIGTATETTQGELTA